ncbi:MAG: DUF4263 domain-containing protein [Geobacter sp.]|nr:MAG: DUF4263 domain-containing protein [Geobacter sp.]
MKILDIVHSFHNNLSRVSRGLCRVRSFIGPEGQMVLLTDLGEKNDGQSVTIAVEMITRSLIEQGIIIEPVTFIEHYERGESKDDTFDVVTFSPTTQWQKTTRASVLNLIGGHEEEIADRSQKNPRISYQADQIRYRKNPFADSRYQDSNSVITRRLEIAEGMISKVDIEALVNNGSIEQNIQRVLKQDLSVFGEAYAKPDDEYICFSEFPLADGAVDFAVFTGRSRMDIILIEVKGAEFNLVNADHYREFNHKISQAAGQIRGRLGIIFRDLNTFRKSAHQIRARAEKGEKIHNAFVGPYGELQVDPDKDINIRTVVVGGRTKDDHEESIKRQDYESRFTPPIRIESWDTWLRRLQRS